MKINKISIIIPVYNGAKVILNCLNSIANSKIDIPYEIIVIDDGSTDNTAEIVAKFQCIYIRINKAGVSKARNVGIEKATGDILLFFDADVMLKEDTLSKFLLHFDQDEDADIIQGLWDKHYPLDSYSTKFLLLRFRYNIESLFSNKKRLQVAELMTGCLGMRKEVFTHFKGFDEGYKFAGGEEFEFGLRLFEKYNIFYYPDISVYHKFGTLLQTAKKIYFRTTNYSMLVFGSNKKGQFLKLTENSVPDRDRYSVIITLLLILNSFFFCFNIGLALFLYLFLLVLYAINARHFLLYLYKEGGLMFATMGVLSDIFLMVPRLFGLLKALFIFYILRKKDYKI